ncbi:hypothetical protein FGIG_07106 [Fasciola gigantica]|uniref:Uncharacterized protein n=1 Tax=Fasciola gigantica TaxID=46835 RepID=A0A504Z3I1_FASGI|nr:hypothetical protein FGIG_07106 [Fasciola gigantica]
MKGFVTIPIFLLILVSVTTIANDDELGAPDVPQEEEVLPHELQSIEQGLESPDESMIPEPPIVTIDVPKLHEEHSTETTTATPKSTTVPSAACNLQFPLSALVAATLWMVVHSR